ncbi:MAG: hypothetical protein ACYSWZ_26885 [Planctomycetota bacterium]
MVAVVTVPVLLLEQPVVRSVEPAQAFLKSARQELWVLALALVLEVLQLSVLLRVLALLQFVPWSR